MAKVTKVQTNRPLALLGLEAQHENHPDTVEHDHSHRELHGAPEIVFSIPCPCVEVMTLRGQGKTIMQSRAVLGVAGRGVIEPRQRHVEQRQEPTELQLREIGQGQVMHRAV